MPGGGGAEGPEGPPGDPGAPGAVISIGDTSSITLGITLGELTASAVFGSSAGTITEGNDSRLSDTRVPSAHSHAESDVTSLVSDLAGKAATSHSHAEADVTSLVADLAGKAAASHSHAESDVTLLVSDLAGKAATSHAHAESDITSLISDLAAKQPLDSDLTAIAALAPTNDDVIQRKAGAWSNRTMAQIKTDLALVKADVGLGSVDNTADSAKPVSTAQQTALDLKQNLDSDLTTIAALAPADDSFIQRKSGIWVSRTMAQLKTDLVLVKADVGLGNVDNTTDAGKPVSTAQQTALDLKAPVGAKYIVQQADATLTAEQALGALGTGILKNTTTTGILSIAAGGDLPAHTHVEGDTTNLTTDLAAKATAGAALTEAAEGNSTPVAGATSTALTAGIRVFAFFTLPTTEKWYVITGIEWLNKATVNGNVWCGVERVDANPPVLAPTVLVAWGVRVVQTGANGVQRNSQISSNPIRGGTILGVWFVSDSATGTFGNTSSASLNQRKTIAAGVPSLADVTAWTASAVTYYVKAYYRGIV
jgi:hypothetical protein